jgi:hypothetical protein
MCALKVAMSAVSELRGMEECQEVLTKVLVVVKERGRGSPHACLEDALGSSVRGASHCNDCCDKRSEKEREKERKRERERDVEVRDVEQ